MESRALFFTPEVCRQIKERCVPFARNSLISSGYGADSRFWDKLAEQGPHLGNSMFLCTASGRAVEGFQHRFLGIWLDGWERLPESERRPGAVTIAERGSYREDVRNPLPPERAMIVKTYTRALHRDEDGKYSAPEKLSLGISKTVIKAEPNRDYLWLTAAEAASLVPANPKPGDKYEIPPRFVIAFSDSISWTGPAAYRDSGRLNTCDQERYSSRSTASSRTNSNYD